MSNGLFPAISDLGREVRYRYFDRPLFERARQQVYDEMEEHLACLAANPEAPDRHHRVRTLIECPQPLFGSDLQPIFVRRPDHAQIDVGGPDLALLPHSKTNELPLRALWTDNAAQPLTTITKDKRIHVFTTHAEYSHLTEAARALFPMIAEVPADHDIVIDFYIFHSGKLGDPEATQQELRSVTQSGRLSPLHPAHCHYRRRGWSQPWHARHAFHLSPQREYV